MPKRSQKLFKEAKKYLVGGVNSPLRSFYKVGGSPLFIKKGRGARVEAVDGKEYIDYVMGWGALILGHANLSVMEDVKAALEKGSSFGLATEGETILAKLICRAFPSIEKVRLVSTGTEAVMGALKLAKAFTKREKIIKFKECYHGWSEQPYLEAAFNDLNSVKRLISKEIAAIIVEPVAGNCGVIPPLPGFLEGLRKLCDKNGILLVFDEVITGFRLAYGGAQERFGVKADLTCLGKIVGGGFPLAAFGGKKEIINLLAPEGPVYQAGTFSGNPIAVSAGIRTLSILSQEDIYRKLEERTASLCEGIKIKTSRVGSMFSFDFKEEREYKKFFRSMLKAGALFAPALRESNFVSLAHGEREIDDTIEEVNKRGSHEFL